MSARFYFPSGTGLWDLGSSALPLRNGYFSGDVNAAWHLLATNNAVTAGTNAQGQGPLTAAYNVVTTAANNPSGVTLPTAAQGRAVTIVNKGANPLKVYPASGAQIDALGANVAIDVPLNASITFRASSTTQWYSDANPTLTGPIFHARRFGSQSIPHNTATKIAVNTEDFDIGNCFDSTTNNRFQPTVPGYYQFNYSVYADNGATDLQLLVASLAKNGTIVYGGDLTAGSFFYSPATPVAAAVSAGSEIIFLNGSTDYVELFARAVRAPGTANTVQGGFLSGYFVRP